MKTTGRLTIRDVQIAYTDEGEGPIVINAHGLAQSRNSAGTFGVIEPGGLVDAGYRIISYDARGHGDSTGTAEPHTYEWDELAKDLLAIADHFSPHEPVRAMGLSMGTGTVLSAAMLAPDRFAAIALGAPPTAWETRADQGVLYERLAQMVEQLTKEEFLALLAKTPIAPIFAETPHYPGRPTPPFSLLPSVFRGAGRSDLPVRAELLTLAVPTLILAWTTDAGHPVSTAHSLRDALSASSLHESNTTSDIETWASRAAAFFTDPAA